MATVPDDYLGRYRDILFQSMSVIILRSGWPRGGSVHASDYSPFPAHPPVSLV